MRRHPGCLNLNVLLVITGIVLGGAAWAEAQLESMSNSSEGQPLGRGAQVGDGRVLSDIQFGRDVGEPVADPGLARRRWLSGEGDQAQSRRFDRAENGERWRYVWFNDRWWYWNPSNRWLIWAGNRWVDYDELFPDQATDIVQSHRGTYGVYYRRGFNSPYWDGYFYPYGDYPGAYPQTWGPNLGPQRYFGAYRGGMAPENWGRSRSFDVRSRQPRTWDWTSGRRPRPGPSDDYKRSPEDGTREVRPGDLFDRS